MHQRSSIFALTIALLAGTGLGQDVQIKNDPKQPIQIVSVVPQITTGTVINGVRVVFRNNGPTEIVALSAVLRLRFSNSTSNRIVISQDHIGLGYAAGTSGIAPGQIYERVATGRITPQPGVTLVGIDAEVDYVEMADGSTYGKDADGVKTRFAHMRYAKRTERARLLKIYQQQGLNELLGELNRR